MIADKTEMGFKAIINHQYWGLLYANELYQRVRKGQVVDGYIKRVRDDGKVDLTLSQPGFSKDKMSGNSVSNGNVRGLASFLTTIRTIRYEHLVAGISGGVVSTLVLHPLDLLKIRFAGKTMRHVNEISICIKQITENKWT